MKNVLETAYSLSFDGEWQKLDGGYECDVWQVDSLIVRICPEWRTDGELRWVYDLVAHCAQHIPQVIAPIKTKDGEDFIRIDNRPVLVFPYIDGSGDSMLIAESARMLANIHKTAMRWLQRQPPRPASHQSAPQVLSMEHIPDYIKDPELDTWLDTVYAEMPKTMGVIHGDFYRGNILCKDGQITGIIDWDECRVGPIIEEVAWSMWEFCQIESRDDLDMEKTRIFLQAYQEVNSGLPSTEYQAIIPLIRSHLRYEILRSLAAEQNGYDWDEDYRQQEIRAFKNLRLLNNLML